MNKSVTMKTVTFVFIHLCWLFWSFTDIFVYFVSKINDYDDDGGGGQIWRRSAPTSTHSVTALRPTPAEVLVWSEWRCSTWDLTMFARHPCSLATRNVSLREHGHGTTPDQTFLLLVGTLFASYTDIVEYSGSVLVVMCQLCCFCYLKSICSDGKVDHGLSEFWMAIRLSLLFVHWNALFLHQFLLNVWLCLDCLNLNCVHFLLILKQRLRLIDWVRLNVLPNTLYRRSYRGRQRLRKRLLVGCVSILWVVCENCVNQLVVIEWNKWMLGCDCHLWHKHGCDKYSSFRKLPKMFLFVSRPRRRWRWTGAFKYTYLLT